MLVLDDLKDQLLQLAADRDIDLTWDDFRLWREGLEAIPGGGLCLESFCAELQLDLDTKIELMLACVISYKDAIAGKAFGRASELTPYDSLKSACQGFPDLGIEITASPGELSRFVDFDQACRRHFPRRGVHGVNNSFDNKIWRYELSVDEVVRDGRLRSLQGRIRGGEDVNLFSTLSSWVEEQGCIGPNLAERARDGLGLPHLDGKDVLEIRLTEASVRQRGALRKPTFADSGGYPPFMPSQDKDVYGYARDLSSENLSSRGGPEVWHGPVPAREASGIRLLGKPAKAFKIEYWRSYNQWWSLPR